MKGNNAMIFNQNTARTRLANPTAVDRHLLNDARYVLRTNQAGACVVLLPSSSFDGNLEASPHTLPKQSNSPPKTQPNPQRNSFSKRGAKNLKRKNAGQLNIF
jgi:hypothetical protein